MASDRTVPKLGCALAICIVLYDAALKRTWVGPVAMGACRFLNVRMGMAACVFVWPEARSEVALAVGLYITGVTWFARSEAKTSQRISLIQGVVIMIGGLLYSMLGVASARDALGEGSLLLPAALGAVFAAAVGTIVVRSIRDPSPTNVQKAVKAAVLGLIGLDAIVAVGLAGPIGLTILLLLPPALVLGRWIYST
jgi:4-hydroxybenzoate polyprenyltransferase